MFEVYLLIAFQVTAGSSYTFNTEEESEKCTYLFRQHP